MQIDTDTLRAALEGAVKLEWFPIGSAGDLRAVSVVGRYEIILQPDGCSLILGRRSVWHKNVESAKATAKNDCAVYILSSIDLDTLAAKLGGGE